MQLIQEPSLPAVPGSKLNSRVVLLINSSSGAPPFTSDCIYTLVACKVYINNSLLCPCISFLPILISDRESDCHSTQYSTASMWYLHGTWYLRAAEKARHIAYSTHTVLMQCIGHVEFNTVLVF